MKPIFTCYWKEAQMFESPYSLVFHTNLTKQYTYYIQEEINMRQSRCPLTGKWIDCGIHTMEYYIYRNTDLMNCGSIHLHGWILKFLSKL